jgi:hypothetical protein
MIFGFFESVHAQSFEKSQARRVADVWERVAAKAIDFGYIDLYRVALGGASAVLRSSTLDEINEASKRCQDRCMALHRDDYMTVRREVG